MPPSAEPRRNKSLLTASSSTRTTKTGRQSGSGMRERRGTAPMSYGRLGIKPVWFGKEDGRGWL